MTDDLLHMRAALALARRGLGNAWPNPAVGCVLVKDGRVIGRGWTQPGGRPMAHPAAQRSLHRGQVCLAPGREIQRLHILEVPRHRRGDGTHSCVHGWS